MKYILSRPAPVKIVLIGIVLGGTLLFGNFSQSVKLPTAARPQTMPIAANSVTTTALAPATVGLPVRLTIPRIKVSTKLEHVGLTSGGAVGVPRGIANAAWFDRSTYPGNVGSAVITGHYGRWQNGAPAVFNNINKLRAGDKLYVLDSQGVTTTFVVRAVRTYGAKDSVLAVFGASDGQAHLNLITCQGVWNNVTKSYPKRLVIFTDKVSK